MTTVAWDGHTLAADTQCTAGDSFYRPQPKIYQVTQKIICGISGDIQNHTPFIQWLKKGSPHDRKPALSEQFEAIVVTESEVIEYENKLSRVQIAEGECLAIGSGWKWATAAMDHGKAAVQAVEYAITRDIYSGGKVQYLLRPKSKIR